MSDAGAEFFAIMREALCRIRLYVEGFTADSFLEDQRTIDAVGLNLLDTGECVARLPTSAPQGAVPWRTIVALRHRIPPGYTSGDPEILWAIAQDRAPALLHEIEDLERR